jgi:hypothetical protein
MADANAPTRKIVRTPNAPQSPVYSQAVRAAGLVLSPAPLRKTQSPEKLSVTRFRNRPDSA